MPDAASPRDYPSVDDQPASGVNAEHGEYALETYAPAPRARRSGIALCLSGGGYRAALFHLGALRRLNELGILSQVDTLSSVSGGSILSAHLAECLTPWPAAGAVFPDWVRRVEEPFRAFTRRNIRTLPILMRWLPWNWFRSSTGAEALVSQYERYLTRRRLNELPDRPRFVFCATDMAFGVNWVFDSGALGSSAGRLGDYQAGYMSPLPARPLAQAVAASSCFPPVFNPLPLRVRPEQLTGGRFGRGDRVQLIEGLRLSDGGVYDNLGLEPVWKDHRVVLVSDGGGVFEAEEERGLLWRLNRYLAIAGRQGGALRKRWLISNFISEQMEGAYWGIGSISDHYEKGSDGYSPDLVDEVISEVRTDLDAFSEEEASVLVNHGYRLADAAIQSHSRGLVSSAAPLQTPYPDWMDEARVRKALAESHKLKLLGRR